MSYYVNPVYVYYKIYDWFQMVLNFTIPHYVIFWFNVIWLSFSLSLIVFIVVIWMKREKLITLKTKELEKSVVKTITETETREELAWKKITNYLNSTNPSDWKLAILEADTLLDSMILGMGYKGENLGERLKTIEPSDFNTLNEAWEAHKVRNQIAHESSFELSHKEAVRVLTLFEKVFKEFGYI